MNKFLSSPKELIDELVRSIEQMNEENKTTPAHQAVARLVKSFDGITLITENIDLKHETADSNIPVHHMSKGDFGIIKAKTDSGVDLLLTAGLSSDDRAVISYLKRKKPQITIAAVTVPEGKQPDIIGEKDFLVLQDAQVFFPKLLSEIVK